MQSRAYQSEIFSKSHRFLPQKILEENGLMINKSSDAFYVYLLEEIAIWVQVAQGSS